jgi:hypothetical protein
VAGHVAISTQAPNPVALWLLCPCDAFTERIYTGTEPSPYWHLTNPLGVFPFLCSAAARRKRGEWRKSGGGRRRSRAPCRC